MIVVIVVIVVVVAVIVVMIVVLVLGHFLALIAEQCFLVLLSCVPQRRRPHIATRV